MVYDYFKAGVELRHGSSEPKLYLVSSKGDMEIAWVGLATRRQRWWLDGTAASLIV